MSFSGVREKEEASFIEVSGITMEKGIEELPEGGGNENKDPAPAPIKFPNLMLERGLAFKTSVGSTERSIVRNHWEL
ncbi:phage tail protein [Cyclobacterium xiamenense]|uniref:phage tail protein n=1 Tax=Cyclobacterium xiamenense TaxID=1297121 RepID=UPI0035CF813D